MTGGVSVLLSFYKGQKYFKEQFESIIIQIDEFDELIIRDDGSNSLKYLKSIIASNTLSHDLFEKGQITILEGSNLGVNKSFLHLLTCARNPVSIFCDQDDMWVSDRLDSARKNSSSDLHCVNYSVDAKPQFPPQRLRQSYFSLIRNFVPGCCMSGKTSYLSEILSLLPDNLIYDHSLLYVSLSSGRCVTFDNEILVRYRRHSDTFTKYGSFAPNGIRSAIALRCKLIALKRKFK